MLNLGRLRVLQEVVTRGSFSSAADALSYTQSAVSQAVARLDQFQADATLAADPVPTYPSYCSSRPLDSVV